MNQDTKEMFNILSKLDKVDKTTRIVAENAQKDVELKGWAFESRVYAEDPSRGFLPSSGRINLYIEPEESKNIRVDSGVYEGGEVSMFYDAMVSKTF